MKDPEDRVTVELDGLPAGAKKRGRPAKHADAAAKQAAYRARLKAAGKGEIRHIGRVVRADAPLQSDILDLSEVRQRPPKRPPTLR